MFSVQYWITRLEPILITTIKIVAILIIARLTNRFMQRSIQVIQSQQKLPVDVTMLISRTFKLIILGIAGIMILHAVGIDPTAIVASLGVGGLALSFALKDLLSNVVSGIMIMIYRPFTIGDFITISIQSNETFAGQIINIDLRYTSLKSDAGITLIPNSMIITNPVIVKKG